MDTNPERLLFKDEVFQRVGYAIEVLKALGHGIVEKPNENAAHYGLTCRSDSQFQTPETRVGANGLINWCPFVSIRGY